MSWASLGRRCGSATRGAPSLPPAVAAAPPSPPPRLSASAAGRANTRLAPPPCTPHSHRGPPTKHHVPSPPSAPEPFHLWGEIKTNLRHSPFLETRIFTPTGPGPFNFVPTGFQRTPDAGTALELQNVTLGAEGDLGLGVAAKVELHVL